MKKAQGISLNVIIVAAIALLVLVVLAFIFTGRIALFSKGLADCDEVAGASCEYDCSDLGEGYIKDPTRACFDASGDVIQGESCCVKVG